MFYLKREVHLFQVVKAKRFSKPKRNELVSCIVCVWKSVGTWWYIRQCSFVLRQNSSSRTILVLVCTESQSHTILSVCLKLEPNSIYVRNFSRESFRINERLYGERNIDAFANWWARVLKMHKLPLGSNAKRWRIRPKSSPVSGSAEIQAWKDML